MKLSDFIYRGLVKKTSKDLQLAKSLYYSTESDLKFLSTLSLNEGSARTIMTSYYDALRSILEAISTLDGYKMYSHEAFTFYLKEKNEEVIAEKFDRLRKIRNSIVYYGKSISIDEVEEHRREILKLIKQLKQKYIEQEMK